LQDDPGLREGFDEHACAGVKVFAFAGGQHNVLAAFIERDPDFACVARNPAPPLKIHALCPSFRKFEGAMIGSWPERDLLVLDARKCASNFSHPASCRTLSPGWAWRSVVAGKLRLLELGNEAIAAAVTKRTHRSLLAK